MTNNIEMYNFDLPVNKSTLVKHGISAFKKVFNEPNTLSLINNKNLFESRREIENLIINFKDVICTTYFTTKIDPQRQKKIKKNSIEYIAPWYNSIKALGLNGIVFYDNLSKEFLDKYQTEQIKFVKCTLGNYSLNDERFILYYMFFLKHKVNNILFTDGNDVIINKSPFQFFESKKESTIFVGRGRHNKLLHSNWNMLSVKKLLDGLNTNVPNNFYDMAIYNAGIVGGNYSTVMYFLRQICSVFFKIDNDKNNNMAAMHYVLYYYYFPNCRQQPYSWFYNLMSKDLKLKVKRKIKEWKLDFLHKENINYKNDKTGSSKHIYSGFPLNSKFKFFETNSEAFLIHK